MKIDIKELNDKYFKEALEETKKFVSFPSYKQDSKPLMPFGKGIKDMLDYAINLGKRLGFKVYQDPKNRYGYLDYGDGEELFVILCHLDVVPPGKIEQWYADPFTVIEKDGKLIARGIIDDKGPTVMNIYAVKYLMDKGFKPKYKIRLIFGLAEETTWESIKAYIEDNGVSHNGYVPDGAFPVIYAEKSVINLDINSKFKSDFEIESGIAYNVVADHAWYKGPKQKEISDWLKKNKIETEIKDGKLLVQGKAAHASTPFLGVNAATWLCKALFENGIKHPIIDYVANNVYGDFQLLNVVGNLKDETGELSQNLGILSIKDGQQKMGYNYRIPVFTKPEAFLDKLEKYLKPLSMEIKIGKVENSVYVSKDSDTIKKLMKAYQDVTGDMKSQPLAIGGGTYAKSMPGLVAFGGLLNINDFCMHEYNEWTRISDLQKMLEIYTKAIAILTK